MNWLGVRVSREIESSWTVLDLGCGNLVTTGRLGSVHLAVDAFRPYLDAIKASGPTLLADIADAVNLFPDKSYDAVLMLDVLEHLEAGRHQHMIENAERIARKRVFVFSPDGWMQQEAWDAWALGFNHLQEHRSEVHASLFEQRGYEVSRHSTQNHHGTKQEAFLAIKRF
jgi:hypothetical protein